MAQRKPASPRSNAPRSNAGSRPPATNRPPANRPPAKKPAKKPGRSIVNQRQTPWTAIITAVLVVLFAGGIIGYAVSRGGSHNGSSTAGVDPNDPYRHPELAAAKAIPGVTYHVEPNHNHVTSGTVKYDTSPPTGGDHSPFWADCTGTVYPQAIANENAVHMLEHGAVWITYRPGLDQADVNTLAKLVTGQDRLAMSPYPGLKSAISLQAWGYQLFVDKASDPRIQQFIQALRYNQQTTPEPGATCSNPDFKSHPSSWGKPIYG